jgi:SPP1 family predicted phage head-tail adaptor
MDPGELDQRVTLQTRTAGQDSLGNKSLTWTDVAEVWASYRPIRGTEYFAAGQIQAVVDAKFIIRYRDNVTSSMRLTWRGTPYDIVTPIEWRGAKRYLELMCTSGIRDGR